MESALQTVNIHEAKTNLSKLIAKAVNREPFIIAKAGKPMVKVIAIHAPKPKPVRSLGFMKGQLKFPKDFDTMCAKEIEEMFYGKP